MQTDTETDRQTERQTDRDTDRETQILITVFISKNNHAISKDSPRPTEASPNCYVPFILKPTAPKGASQHP